MNNKSRDPRRAITQSAFHIKCFLIGTAGDDGNEIKPREVAISVNKFLRFACEYDELEEIHSLYRDVPLTKSSREGALCATGAFQTALKSVYGAEARVSSGELIKALLRIKVTTEGREFLRKKYQDGKLEKFLSELIDIIHETQRGKKRDGKAMKDSDATIPTSPLSLK